MDAIDRALPDITRRLTREHASPASASAVGTPPETPEVIDAAVIEELERLSSDPTFLERLLQGVRTDLAQLKEKITEAVQRRDLDGISSAAHAMKGAAGSVGAKLLFQFSAHLEKMSRADVTTQSHDLVTQLSAIARRTDAALESYIRERPRSKQSSTH